jgi:hypothetical protein
LGGGASVGGDRVLSLQNLAISIYAVLFTAFTVVVGRALRTRGRVFLDHTFGNQPTVARSVHFLLDLGFYLLCLSLLLWNIGAPPTGSYQIDPANPGAMISMFGISDVFQSIALRLGISIFVVAAFHSLNILILAILNRKSPDERSA